MAEGDYVAEIGVRVALHAGRDVRDRQRLDPANRWGIARGYWDAWYQPDRSGFERPVGLILTVQFPAFDRAAAEDVAIGIGDRVARLAAFYSGSPPSPCRLIRLAAVNDAGALVEQWNYFYDSESPPSTRLVERELHEFLRRMSGAEEEKGQNLELAARWYALSTAGLSPIDQYLALWVGLEAIGPLLAPYYHSDSPRASCDVCGNEAGKKRARGPAAIEHLIKQLAPEVFAGRSYQGIYGLRNDIVHGLRPSAELEEEVAPLVPDLQLCLGAGVLVAHSGPASEPAFGWQGALPRDYEERPDARSHLRSERPLPDHRPYIGGWVSVSRIFDDADVGVNDKGEYRRLGTVKVGYQAQVPSGISEADVTTKYTLFGRSGVDYELKDRNVKPPETLQVEEWRPQEISPAWQRVAEKQRSRRSGPAQRSD